MARPLEGARERVRSERVAVVRAVATRGEAGARALEVRVDVVLAVADSADGRAHQCILARRESAQSFATRSERDPGRLSNVKVMSTPLEMVATERASSWSVQS